MTKKSKSRKKRSADHDNRRGDGKKGAGKRKLADRLPALFVVTFLVLGLGAMAWNGLRSDGTTDGGATLVDVKPPATLSPLAVEGKKAYDANCARCHGANAAGSNNGPPFVHTIYNPGHHGDYAFLRAVRQGVPQHHWNFGNMPPQPQVTDDEVLAIIRYVRELQKANGITYKKHVM